MSDSILLERGQKGLLIGQNGSGKTENALWQLRHADQWPVIIFDTKIEPKFMTLPDADQTMDLIEGVGKFNELSRNKKLWPDFILVRPTVAETHDVQMLDDYNAIVYERFKGAFTYYDEIYSWHNHGKPGQHFVGNLTRGRSKGITILMGAQRPGWLSRFCLTESKKFYVYHLVDNRDRKALAEVIPGFDECPQPDHFHFYYYDSSPRSRIEYFKPLPLESARPVRPITKNRWY
jgi:hypothetical protein